MNFWRRINWKWRILGAIVAVVGGIWIGLGLYAKRGLYDFVHEFKKNPEYESSVFWWIGPSTRFRLKEITDSKYSISVFPLDWAGSGQLVTHTAFVTAGTKTLKLRLRFNPLDRYFHIVGFANEPK